MRTLVTLDQLIRLTLALTLLFECRSRYEARISDQSH